MAVIKLQNISKLYGFGDATTVALDSVDLLVDKGEFIAIMGPSGSGKSTLMNIMGLLDRATNGSYVLDNKNVSKLRGNQRAKWRRDKIGFIFQDANLLPRMTVIENVALPLAYKGVPPVRRLKKASEILEKLGMQEREYYMPHQLSGGQIQRAAIARALVNEPSIILADEPTGNLDTLNSRKIMRVLRDLHKTGHTILMVTHNPELTRYADRVILMRDGQIQHDDELAAGEMVDLKKIIEDQPKKKRIQTIKPKKPGHKQRRKRR